MKEGQTQESKEPSCTLTNEELIKRCNEWVYKLAETGGNAWSLRVPVDFNNDPDILFIELSKRLATPPPAPIKTEGEDFESIAKTIILSIDHYRQSGRDDIFNIRTIADYLERCFSAPPSPLGIDVEAFQKAVNEAAEKQGNVNNSFKDISRINSFKEGVFFAQQYFNSYAASPNNKNNQND